MSKKLKSYPSWEQPAFIGWKRSRVSEKEDELHLEEEELHLEEENVKEILRDVLNELYYSKTCAIVLISVCFSQIPPEIAIIILRKTNQFVIIPKQYNLNFDKPRDRGVISKKSHESHLPGLFAATFSY